MVNSHASTFDTLETIETHLFGAQGVADAEQHARQVRGHRRTREEPELPTMRGQLKTVKSTNKTVKSTNKTVKCTNKTVNGINNTDNDVEHVPVVHHALVGQVPAPKIRQLNAQTRQSKALIRESKA